MQPMHGQQAGLRQRGRRPGTEQRAGGYGKVRRTAGNAGHGRTLFKMDAHPCLPDANRGWQAHGRIGVPAILNPACLATLPPWPAINCA